MRAKVDKHLLYIQRVDWLDIVVVPTKSYDVRCFNFDVSSKS